MLLIVLGALGFLVLYFVVRAAVTHGILDAEDARREREQSARFEEQRRNGTLPDAPTW